MSIKSHYLQIRVTWEQKARLKSMAAGAGRDLSSFVLDKALPHNGLRFTEIVRSLQEEGSSRFALAELNDFLCGLSAADYTEAVASDDPTELDTFTANYVAALVEQAADKLHVDPPEWTSRIEPSDEPYFAAWLQGLRPHLIRASPVPFRRRNLFVDSALGDRV